jgi:hypothetical protein
MLKNLTATAWRLVLALIVISVLMSFFQGWLTQGHPASAARVNVARPWAKVMLTRVLGWLFVVGLIVRLKRWLGARRSESARRRRVEAASSFVGAPERLGGGQVRRGPQRRNGGT